MDSEERKENLEHFIYNLYGIIVHIGKGGKSGHYISYVRSDQDEWFKCNDSIVTKVSSETVLEAQAYILFYHLSIDDKEL